MYLGYMSNTDIFALNLILSLFGKCAGILHKENSKNNILWCKLFVSLTRKVTFLD